MEEMEKEKPSFLDRIKAYLSSSESDEEKPTYQRRLLDSRIEKYLDRNAQAYIEEFGLITSIDLKLYDERYEKLTSRVDNLLDFANESDAQVSELERRLANVKAATKKGKSK
jgi:hypothetical protein